MLFTDLMNNEKMKPKVAPCMGCDKRTPTCHSECKDYLVWKDYERHRKHAEKARERVRAQIVAFRSEQIEKARWGKK